MIARISDYKGMPNGTEAGIRGRVTSIRPHKKTLFVDVSDHSDHIQIMMPREDKAGMDMRLGDIVEVHGYRCESRTGEKSLEYQGHTVLVHPDQYVGENAENRQLLLNRAKLKGLVRQAFASQGITEIDSSTLSRYAGSSNIVPFKTTDSSGTEYFLRFTMELELKRWLCRTHLPLFEIGKLYRNMGESGRRAGEFLALEAYLPYVSLDTGVDFIERLFYSLADEFKVEIPKITRQEIKPLSGWGEGLNIHDQDKLRENYAKRIKRTKEPTILMHQPQPWASPLSKSRLDGTVEDAKLVYNCAGTLMHLSEEKTDYETVRQSLQKQVDALSQSNRPVQLDESFLNDLRSGLPPCLGFFIGLDRLLMSLLNKQNIWEVIPTI